MVCALTVGCPQTNCNIAGCQSSVLFALPAGAEGPFVARFAGETVNGTDVSAFDFDCDGIDASLNTGVVDDGSEAWVRCDEGKGVWWMVGSDRGDGPGPLLLNADVTVTMKNAASTLDAPAIYSTSSSSITYTESQPNGPMCEPTCFTALEDLVLRPAANK